MTFTLRIISPEKTLFSGEASQVVAPGMEGDFGVLPGHMPFVSSLRPGVIVVEQGGGVALRLAVTEGVAEATPGHCTIITESARGLEGISHAEAMAELRAAQEAVQHAIGEDAARLAGARLKMAETVASAV